MEVEAVLDTSIFIALESGREILRNDIPERVGVSVITVGELRAGIHTARTTEARDQRMTTLMTARRASPIPIDEEIAFAWARLHIELREKKRRMPGNDAWIAATAIHLSVPVVTQDADYDDVPRLDVIRV